MLFFCLDTGEDWETDAHFKRQPSHINPPPGFSHSAPQIGKRLKRIPFNTNKDDDVISVSTLYYIHSMCSNTGATINVNYHTYISQRVRDLILSGGYHVYRSPWQHSCLCSQHSCLCSQHPFSYSIVTCLLHGSLAPPLNIPIALSIGIVQCYESK